jgi:excisionase family DNA binding protein
MIPAPAPQYMTPGEVADLLRVSTKTVHRWVADDPSMPALRLKGTVRFPQGLLLRWLADRTSGPARARRSQHQERLLANPSSTNGSGLGSAPVGHSMGQERRALIKEAMRTGA